MLEAREVSRRFGAFTAVNGVDLSVTAGSIYGVIGPNGAGKTTLFDVLSGFLRPSSGRVAVEGVDLTGASVSKRVAAGLVRTFQTPRLFDEMTVAENLAVAACARRGSLLGQLYLSRNAKAQIGAEVERVLERLGLKSRAQVPCGELEFAPRRLTEVGRALSLHPRVLLLDEPVAGMNAAETAGFASLVRSIREDGVTVVIIDHDVDFILGLCEHCTVLDLGSVIAAGTPEQVRSDAAVVDAYLGAAA